MDLTPIFKANVKAVKLRNKATSSLTGIQSTVPKLDKNRILQRQNRDEFSKLAKDVCHKITELRNLLIDNRAAYMRFAQHLKRSAQMTDEQRDLIDTESEKFITYYTQYLGQIRSDWRRQKLKKQFKEHIENVIELLNNYLKSVNNLHLEQKKYRMQHELETYRLLKLASDKKSIPIRPGTDEIINNEKRDKSNSIFDEEIENNHQNSIANDNDDDGSNEPKEKQYSIEDKRLTSVQQIALDDDLEKSKQEDELSPEDIQMFESENNQLYQELQGLSEEVEQIEKNVVDIARLQEVFTEKVALQKHDIERIANAVVGTTENVKDANEQIKQAIQRNAGVRVWVLFFLLVMSFTLLFLDWYNE